MAKFYGDVGFVENIETSTDIFDYVPFERKYKGEVLKASSRFAPSTYVNDNLVINARISIIANPYLINHIPAIRYVRWKGNTWKVTSVDEQYPRVVLTLGEVYNGVVVKNETEQVSE